MSRKWLADVSHGGSNQGTYENPWLGFHEVKWSLLELGPGQDAGLGIKGTVGIPQYSSIVLS